MQDNWKQLKSQSQKDQARYRDVYNEQVLERGKIRRVSSKGPWYFFAFFLGFIVALITWNCVSFFDASRISGRVQTIYKDRISGTGAPIVSGFDGIRKSDVYDDMTVYQWLFKESNGENAGKYYTVNADGTPTGEYYDNLKSVVRPQWVNDKKAEIEGIISSLPDETQKKEAARRLARTKLMFYEYQKGRITSGKLAFAFTAFFITFGIALTAFMKAYHVQNLKADTKDLNYHANDSHIQLPMEVLGNYDIFPDVGAHSSVSPSAMLSHVMLSNKGVRQIQLAKRHEKDAEIDGTQYYKGDFLLDQEDNCIFDSKPMFDTARGKEIFEASQVIKPYQKYFDAPGIEYNPGNRNYEKLKGFNTVADLINKDWLFPAYEPQRPSGVYCVDTAPVNTLLLAITRGGKGQGYIEAMLDMWTRERRQNNFLVNDPKGELLLKFCVRATVRGYEVIQFNLMNVMKTMVYNPLGLAALAAREGDFTQCAAYVVGIANVFFPVEGADDPLWPNAANNAFKRAAYGLIDYYLEEEKKLKAQYEGKPNGAKLLAKKLDEMWAKVSLYNCYQFFVRLSSKKRLNPVKELDQRIDAGEFEDAEDGELEREQERANKMAELFDGQDSMDMLTLYFNASAKLPVNGVRTLMMDADQSLRSIGGAEKMLSSVYGIAVTAMSFFTDPTIIKLTSGPPSENVDLGGLSFPRRFGVRFNPEYLAKYHLRGIGCRWSAYGDPMFKEPLKGDFSHTDVVSMVGWAMCYFDGIFPKDVSYVKLELVDNSTGMLSKTYYFRFTKSYRLTSDGYSYMLDPILKTKIVKDGYLEELQPVKKDGEIVRFEVKPSMYRVKKVTGISSETEAPHVDENALRPVFKMTQVKYTEKPKAVFVVTPPHLTSYAKLILILIKQLVDLNFEKSYMTKENQKPLYKTRYMLDELGNLQSEGHGIQNFQTMLSIGLGQDQQFTLVLQTLQQLRDVYGDSVDKIIQGNVADIIYLKSTDDSLIDTLTKLSGVTHEIDSNRSITENEGAVAFGTEAKVTLSQSVKERPLIQSNDLLFMPPSNAVVFRAGDNPIWNRNETALPQSRILHKGTIIHPGHKYTLQNVPSLSNVLNFDERKNVPDFRKMLDERIEMALYADEAIEKYSQAYGYREDDILRLDPDNYADDIIELIYECRTAGFEDDMEEPEEIQHVEFDNVEFIEEKAKSDRLIAERQVKKFAGGQLAIENLIGESGAVRHTIDNVLRKAYTASRYELAQDRKHFIVEGQNLKGADGALYISCVNDEDRATRELLREAGQDASTRTYVDGDIEDDYESNYVVQDAFIKFLAGLPTWKELGNGKFEQEAARIVSEELKDIE